MTFFLMPYLKYLGEKGRLEIISYWGRCYYGQISEGIVCPVCNLYPENVQLNSTNMILTFQKRKTKLSKC